MFLLCLSANGSECPLNRMERMEWKEWKEWNGKNGMERMEWNEWNGKNGMERMEWNEWNGKNGMERMEWKEWNGVEWNERLFTRLLEIRRNHHRKKVKTSYSTYHWQMYRKLRNYVTREENNLSPNIIAA